MAGRGVRRGAAVVAAVAFTIFCGAGPAAASSEMDILLRKLVEKGVFSEDEAQTIKEEVRAEAARQAAETRPSAVPSVTVPVPEWVSKMRLKGDLRLRYQYEKRHSLADPRSRGRMRFRLGLEAPINDRLKVGAGLASGGDNPRSTNQDFNNYFATPDIRLDYAYAEYRPASWAKVVGGRFRFKHYLWTTTDLLWDGDITPTGASVHLSRELTSTVEGFLNGGVWVLDDNGTADRPDPFMTYVQGGIQRKTEKTDLRLAGIFYSFNGLQGVDPDFSKDTNTRAAGNVLKYDYDSGGVSVEAGVRDLFGGLPLQADERVAVFGDFIRNPDPASGEVGWAAGAKFGHRKLEEKGDWQMKYIYASLGKDAFPDIFPDGDRYGGRTDAKSHEAIIEYVLQKHVILGLDYYQNQRIKAAEDLEHVLQADVIFKF